LKYSDNDNKTLSAIMTDINPYLIQYAAEVVTGQKELDSSWDEYTATLENMGLSQMMDIINAAYDKVK
jgi:putative aldouronate transport system substrate-binding protein